MLSVLKCLCFIVLIFITGDVINHILFKNRYRNSVFLRLSLAYGFGTGVISLFMFYTSVAGFELCLKNLICLMIPFVVVFAFLGIRKIKKGLCCFSLRSILKKSRFTEWLLVLFILCSIALVFFKALFLPMHLPDNQVQWGLKAKILYHDKTIFSDDIFDPLRIKLHIRYPFLIPLIESGFFSFMGQMNDRLVKMPFPFYFMSLLFFIYGMQRKYCSRMHALIFTAMLASLPVFIRDISGSAGSGYADVPLAFYYTVSALSLFQWIREENWQDIVLAGVFAGFALFTKQEAAVTIMIIVSIIGCWLVLNRTNRKHGLRHLMLFIAIPVAMLVPWYIYRSSIPVPSWEQDWSLSMANPQYILAHLYRIRPIIISILKAIFTPVYWNFLWVIFFMLLVFYPKRSFVFPELFVVSAVLLNMSALFAAIVFYPWDWWYNFLHDMYRLFMISIPLTVYFISYRVYQIRLFKESEPVEVV